MRFQFHNTLADGLTVLYTQLMAGIYDGQH